MTDDDDDGPDDAAAAGDRPPIRQFTSLRQALTDALEDAPHLRRDRAMIALAFRYADLLDDAGDRLAEADAEGEARDFGRMVTLVSKIGPRLEATLASMGMAPGARTATRGGERDGRPDPAGAALAGLRTGGTPTAGVDPTAFVDPAVTEADAGD